MSLLGFNHSEKVKEYNKKYYLENKDKIAEWGREYRKVNRERINEYWKRNPEKKRRINKRYMLNHKDEISKAKKIYYQKHKFYVVRKQKIYYKNNLDKIRIYLQKNKENINQRNGKHSKERRLIDTNFNITIRLRNGLWKAFKKYTRTGKIMSSKKYGIDYKAIIEHLKPFPQDISKYHIDHIKPLCSFSFINTDGTTNLDEVKTAFAPQNHQWLTIQENLSKSGRMI